MNAIEQIRNSIEVGVVLDNPGGGKSEIVIINKKNIYYQRGEKPYEHNPYNLQWEAIENVLIDFSGKTVSTNDLLKKYPEWFKHSCNRTFLFSLLKHAGLIEGEFQGDGVSGRPYQVTIKDFDVDKGS